MLFYFWPRQYMNLLVQFTKRDIRQRYRSSWLGMGWSIITPLIMLAVYTFVFQYIFKARWPSMALETHAGVQYALNLFAGLIVFTGFSDIVNRAPGLISQQPNLVKKVVFPLHLIAWSAVLSATFQALISVMIIFLGVVFFTGHLPLGLLLLPFIFLMFLPMLLGIAWGLSALGVYLPDTQHLASIITAPLMFLSPIFYPISMLPDWAQQWILLNPLTLVIESVRAALLGSPWPSLTYLIIYTGASVVMGLLGAALFHKLRKGFADVL